MDLYIVIGYTALVSAVLGVLSVGNLPAILLVLFVPGYVLVAVLFPGSVRSGESEISWIERISLSFSLSVAVVPLLSLLLNFTPWGIRLTPIVATITLFTVGVGYVAYWRRMRLPPDKRLSLDVDLALPNLKEYSPFEKVVAIALSASIVVAIGVLAYVVLLPRPVEKFTQFYVLGPGGNAFGYPTTLNVSQPGTVLLGIVNHESTSVNYTVRIDVIGMQVVYNATSGFNETVEVNRTTWSTLNVTLADGRNWTQPYSFSIPYVGVWKIQFLLFRDGDFSNAYQELHLPIRVR